jgi:pyridoxine/pyridoxamine 5'-phosphate oxidase
MLNTKININQIEYNLKDLEEFVWKKLVNGAVKKKNGFRTMCVGTTRSKSDAMLRIVVNRKVDEINKKIYFYTDIRSRKFEDLQKNKSVTLLFYDSKQNIQIVAKAKVFFHIDDELQKERWRTTSPQARLGYMTIDAPNTKSEAATLGYEERFATIKPTDAESDIYKENFVVIECNIHELEFLFLNFSGNRKANFSYKNGILENSFWAVP